MNIYGLSMLLAVLGIVMAVSDLLLFAATPTLLKRLSRMSPDQRASATFLWRFAPVGLSFLAVLGVFLPAWLRHEPANTGEEVSRGLAFMAAFAVLPVLHGLHRAWRMYFKTRDHLLTWRDLGHQTSRAGEPFDLVEVRSEELGLCVGGYLRPTIYASTRVLNSLEPEEFSAALAHEISHATSRDPLRLLWMGSCPDFLLLFGLDGAWRQAFSRASEFAADAGATRGNPALALDLASALLKVARIRTLSSPSSDGMMDVAVSSAFVTRADLEARVEALASPGEGSGTAGLRLRPWMFVAAALLLCGFGALESEQVHALTETMGHLFGILIADAKADANANA